MGFRQLILLGFIGLLVSCSVPRDPENSWEKAKSEGLKVGIVESGPFAQVRGDSLGGKEVQMIEEFARQNQLKVNWEKGRESDLVEKMKDYKIHIIIGGFKKSTVWKKEVGLTKAYDQQHVWLVARGENRLVAEIEKFFFKKFPS